MSTLVLAPLRQETPPPSVQQPTAAGASSASTARPAARPTTRPVARPGDSGPTGESVQAAPYIGHLVGVDPRLHVLLSTLARLARPFAHSQWQLDPEQPADALIIGLQTPEGVRAYRSQQTGTGMTEHRPVLVIGSQADLRRLELDPLPDLLLLAPPIKHLSFAYCVDVLATRVHPTAVAAIEPDRQPTDRHAPETPAGEPLASGARWQLRAFPAARLLKKDPITIRLAAHLLAGPITAETLQERSGASSAVITHFLEMARQESLLHDSIDPHREPDDSTARPSATPRVAPRLIAALRGWLGL